MYTLSAANASRVAGHVVGDDDNVKKCPKATIADKQLANSKRTVPKKTKAVPKSSKRARAEGALGLDDRTIVDIDLDDRPEIAARMEDVREAGLNGYFKKMMSKEERDELDMVWTKALFMNSIPPNVLDQDDFRDAIMRTSMATTQYTPPKRNVMERVESDWSTVDESDAGEQEVGDVIGEAVPARLGGRLPIDAAGAARAAERDAAADNAVAATPRPVAAEQQPTRAAQIGTAGTRVRPPLQVEHRTGAVAAAGSRRTGPPTR